MSAVHVGPCIKHAVTWVWPSDTCWGTDCCLVRNEKKWHYIFMQNIWQWDVNNSTYRRRGAALLFIRIIHIIESANCGDVQWKSAVSTQKLQLRTKLLDHVRQLQFNWRWNLGASNSVACLFAYQKTTIDQSPASLGPNCFKQNESLADHYNALTNTTPRSRRKKFKL